MNIGSIFSPLRAAIIGAVRHRMAIVQRAEDLGQETLEVHIAARLTQALGRALLRAEKKVIHVEHIARQLCLQGRGQRGLSGGAAAIDGDKHARLRGRERTDAPQKSGFKISHTQHLPSRECLIIIPQARAVKPGISSA